MVNSLPINFWILHWSKKVPVPTKNKHFNMTDKSKREILFYKNPKILTKKCALSTKKLWMFFVLTTAKLFAQIVPYFHTIDLMK
jgi:hypothetical protein